MEVVIQSQKDISSTNTGNCVKKKEAVLLQMAKAVGCDVEGTNKANVCILFDSGSQQSYVTEPLKDRLNLTTTRKERLHLNTFGSECFMTQQCEVVKVQLAMSGSDENIVIEALSFPIICTLLPSRAKVDRYPCLKELELADDHTDKTTAIDIGLLLDYNYWGSIWS